MDDERSTPQNEIEPVKPALTPLGTPPESPIRSREGDIIHTAPEFAIAEADVRSAEAGEFVAGTSLWKDAWRRLLKNRLAVFGMIVAFLVAVLSIIGPSIIKKTTGYAPEYIPPDSALVKSFPPFRAPDGAFSWKHPMGTDIQGCDPFALVLRAGRVSV